MGGSGSGRRTFRRTVDYSIVIDLSRLIKKGLFENSVPDTHLYNRLTEKKVISISYGFVKGRYDDDYFFDDDFYFYEDDEFYEEEDVEKRYKYRLDIDYSIGENNYSHEQQIRLIQTPCNYGGVRWWMICPGCGYKGYKLYYPGGGQGFLCRNCHDFVLVQREMENRPV